MSQGKKRVVVGINVFDASIGAQVAAAPVHSDAYREAMAELQVFSRAPLGVSLATAETALIALAEGEQVESCTQCRGTPPGGCSMVSYGGAWFCSVACLKSYRKQIK